MNTMPKLLNEIKTDRRLQKYLLFISLMTVGSFIWTQSILLNTFTIILIIILITFLITYYVYRFTKDKGRERQINIIFFAVSSIFLLLVGATGWFYSPFF